MNLLRIEGPLLGQGKVCETILADLPDWFGIDEANQNYANESENLPTWVAHVGEEVVGFTTIKQHSAQSAELYVLGVLRQHHRSGIGRAMIKTVEDHLRQQDIKFLQVKTQAAEANDANYEKTRAFYEGLGYVKLEVLLELWDEANPCLQMIKAL